MMMENILTTTTFSGWVGVDTETFNTCFPQLLTISSFLLLTPSNFS